ncbi:hypothetical protein [Pseudomonas sp. RIT623]|uniref:hypothetical protein n=1 Tax=Pseudomonas sp. RIT623 TaxID=2559075 RepID=UPI001430C1D3|nr:hypothetical protein [Pseudomonas sp. RIT623]
MAAAFCPEPHLSLPEPALGFGEPGKGYLTRILPVAGGNLLVGRQLALASDTRLQVIGAEGRP